ncbi:MAG: glycosyltransferase family 2 protein [Candidatus Eremiobacteraeota bacterium]|nr:glycosyltransferase family 2 protein [Candidatus Eremiobacteraeota bacterium]
MFEELAEDPAIASWAVVNNGGAADACALAASLGGICLNPGHNLGFGAAHNVALRCLNPDGAPYHVILNPDIHLEDNTFADLAEVMDANPQVGLLMPRILYPDGSTQFLCKLLPAPVDLLLRRFAPDVVKQLARNRIATFDLRNFDYESPVSVPSLSGCFMFTRRSVLDSIEGFDERFFLYMEDVDLCRRMAEKSELLYWPNVIVKHEHQMTSYKSFRVLLLHLQSAVAYFNKWGWFTDSTREKANQMAIARLRAMGYDV